MNEQACQLECFSGPLTQALTDKLVTFWENVFGTDFAWLAGPLAGAEEQYTASSLYLFTQSNRIIATCRLTHSRDDLRLGCVGEVATAPGFRGQGLAHKLCQLAVDDFERCHGAALFLASENPIARRLYTDLGWQPVYNSNAMLRVGGPLSPDEFISDYLQSGSDLPVTVMPGGPQYRITMIPVILAPHDWVILDHNAALVSTRYTVQPCCEGLYGRYGSLHADTAGAWFAAVRADAVVVGLASAKHVSNKTFCVEAFTHPQYEKLSLKPLYRQAVDWVRQQGGKEIYTTCARTDPYKETALRAHLTGESPPIEYIDR